MSKTRVLPSLTNEKGQIDPVLKNILSIVSNPLDGTGPSRNLKFMKRVFLGAVFI